MTNRQRVKELFLAAREQEAGARAAWLGEMCAGDVDLRREVESLLAAEQGMPGGYLEAVFGTGLQPGSTVSHYRIVELIGSGGMGEVYRAHDERLGRDVAVKVLPGLAASDETARARLLREARAAASLNHPHVCTIHEVGDADGRIYIAMELLDGKTLTETLRGGELPIDDVVRYGVQIADALEHAHRRRIVHRDLKPGNVVITPDRRAKVLDFGLAKTLTAEEMETATAPSHPTGLASGMLGTPPYMAPEQLRGEPVDERSDLWALGVVLHEMVAGEPPFPGQTADELSDAIQRGSPRPLPTRAPVKLRELIARCLAKDPGHRYQRASDLVAELQAIEEHQDARARPVRVARRRSSLRYLAVVAAIAIVAVLVAFEVWKPRRGLFRPAPGRVESIAVLPFVSSSSGPRDELMELGLADSVIAGLSRSSSLRLRSLASAQRFSSPERDPIDAGRQLGADFVVDGSTEQRGDRVKVTASLLDVRDGTTVWSDSYEEAVDGVFTTQYGIVAAVTAALELDDDAIARAARSPCEGADAEAYRAFLTGRYLLGRLTTERLRQGIAAYRRAIDLDPSCARAYAGLAWAYRAQVVVSDRDPREYFPLARAAAEQAIAIDPGSVEGYAHRGFVELWHDWSWSAAEASFQRAVALGPSSADAHLGYAHLLVFLGRFDEAAEHAQQVSELDPLSPLMNSLSAGLLGAAGHDQAARRGLERALELDPDYWHPLFIRGGIELDGADAQAAIADLERAADRSGGSSVVLGVLAMAYGAGGDRAAAGDVLEQLRARGRVEYVPATALASAHLALGETESALDLLERAHAERDVRLTWLSVDARWNGIRAQPRFATLAQQMGLPNGRGTGRF